MMRPGRRRHLAATATRSGSTPRCTAGKAASSSTTTSRHSASRDTGIERTIPPGPVTAADCDTKVAGLHSDQAKLSRSNTRSAITYASAGTRTPNTAAGRQSGLKRSFEELGEQWDQLALALAGLLPDVRADRQADDSGLGPATEAPFHDPLKRELADEGKPVTSPGEALRVLTVDLVTLIKQRSAWSGSGTTPAQTRSLHGRAAAGRADDRRRGPVRLRPRHPGRRPARRTGQGQPRAADGQLMTAQSACLRRCGSATSISPGASPGGADLRPGRA